MTLVLDAGGVSILAASRSRLEVLRRRGEWPAHVPSIVLTESLTGDHRRDFHANRMLRTCEIHGVGEKLARKGAILRTAVGGSRIPSAVDAIVVALADDIGGATILTSDPRDLRALARHAAGKVTIGAV